MSNLANELSKKTAGELQDILIALKDNFEDAAVTVYIAALNAIESKISEDQFIYLCDKVLV